VSAGAPDKFAVTLTKHIYFEARIRKRTRKPGLDVDTHLLLAFTVKLLLLL
jgi:hypothetical protein